MFRTAETKVLPYYALGMVGLLTIFGIPTNADQLASAMDDGPVAFLYFQVILALGTYNLSQMFMPGGRMFREAMFGSPVPYSINHIFVHTACAVLIPWGVIVAVSASSVWYRGSFSAMLGLWHAWPEVLYRISVTFAALIFIASAGLFRSFLGGYFGFQVLYMLAIADVTFKEFKPLIFLNDYPNHPFPLFNLSLGNARNWPIYNIVYLMIVPATFAYTYKLWRDKQWYLRKA